MNEGQMKEQSVLDLATGYHLQLLPEQHVHKGVSIKINSVLHRVIVETD